MSAKCCPTCKRPFAPEVQLSGKRRQPIYDFVAKHPEGVSLMQITDYVYRDDVNGGPESENNLRVVIWGINREFERRGFGYRITASGGQGSVYRLYPVDSKEMRLGKIAKRLSAEQIASIAKDPRSQRELEDAYGISDTSIQRIKKRANDASRRWAYMGRPNKPRA